MPQQNNGYDCGVYMLNCGEHVLHHMDVLETIQQEDLDNRFKRLITKDLFNEKDVLQQRNKYMDLVERFSAVYSTAEMAENPQE